MKGLGAVKRTNRGFEIVEFSDYNNTRCSLQASSLAVYQKPGTSAIWLGCEDANPRVMAVEAAGLGIKTEETTGWVPYPIPEQVKLSTRMHLTRKQVEKLIPMLQSWLDNDTFKAD